MKHLQQPQRCQSPLFFIKKTAALARWALTLLVCLLALPGMARTWFIAPANSGDGSASSWTNASSNLTNALDNAVSGDQIWVKAGTYRRYDQHSFQLKNGVKLYGGFAGTETSIGARSTNLSAYAVYITNSPTASGTNSTNYDQPVFQIVNANAASVLDRIYINNAFSSAFHGPYRGIGAAIYIKDASPAITNVTFSNGTSEFKGGAIFMNNSSPVFTACTFTNNRCYKEAGGAVWAENNSRPTFISTSFSNNTSQVTQNGGTDAIGKGGAIYIRGGKLTLTNVTFTDNKARNDGGAVFLDNSVENSAFTNVVFVENKSGYNGTFSTTGDGAAINALKSNYVLINSVLYNNQSGGNGGAINNQEGVADNLIPRITNVLFYRNGTGNSYGGAIANDRTAPVITNCTFVDNYCGKTDGAGGVYSSAPTTAPLPFTPIIVNSLFFRNGYVTTPGGGLAGTADIAQLRATTSISYSCFKETSAFFGTGNIPVTGVTAPFMNDGGLVAAKGPDGVWMTPDDGFRPSFCTRTLIDKGNNEAVTNPTVITTDLSGQVRRRDVPLVTDSGNNNGTPNAAIVDIGAYESQDAATLLSLTGSIGNAHTIPNPQELSPDFITNVQSPGSGTSITWQQRVAGGTWETASPASSGFQYTIPELAATTTYRRVAVAAGYCNLQVASNEVVIKVVEPDGVIRGRVTSPNGTAGVQGITITATRRSALPGGPARYTYTTVTGANGNYTISPVYYGDPALSASKDSFSVSAAKQGHIFNFDSLVVELRRSAPEANNIDFIDQTVLSVSGLTYQQCDSCITAYTSNGLPINGTQTCPIDSVSILKDGQFTNTFSGLLDSAYGRYGLAIINPVPTTVTPRFPGHVFSPASTTLTPTTNVQGVDFRDVTTHKISGKFTAGCNAYIGRAVLEFTDVLPLNADSSLRNSCFRRQVTTDAGTGEYQIILPARKYKVKIISFTSVTGANAVTENELLTFINNRTPPDSLIRDISTHDTTLNLLYVRPPFISITQGLNVICSNPEPFALLRQAATDSFRVVAYQGPAALGCPVSDTNNKILIRTNVMRNDEEDSVRLAVTDTGTLVKLVGGIPNIAPPYLKDLTVYYTDKYGRTADFLRRKVLVTGVRPEAATFKTVSPEVPLVVLHDPPGDASFSTWQQSKSISNAVRFYAAAGVGLETWAEAKVGVQTTVGIGVATDISAWGTINGGVSVNATVTPSNEAILTTTTTEDFSTSGNDDVTGTGGDVYVGAALNLIYSKATDIRYLGCGNISSTKRLIIADSGFATQYIYSENYLVMHLIPELIEQAQLSSPADSAKNWNQVRVWQQVIANNAENKRRAAFVLNKSFDGAAGAYVNTTTTSSTKTSSLEFSMEINTQLAVELGFEVSGSGASGGVNVNFRMETGGSESNTVTNETTISYTLDDNTPGDVFSVNVKKDPVYNTPVFELAAGSSSCPTEPGTLPRDDVFFTSNNPVVQNADPTLPANFNLKIVNTSPATLNSSMATWRSFKIGYVQSSNIANETITIAGSQYSSSSPYVTRPLGYLDSIIIPVSVTRQTGSSVFAYEGVQFSIASNCGEDLGKTVSVSAFFTSPCSSISLTKPMDGWVLNKTGNNQIFIQPAGYNLANLSGVNLQYSTGNTWTDGPFLTNAQLANGFFFDASLLPDGPYGIRLRLDCNSGTTFSQRATGTIDRRSPQLFGRPTPTDDRYVNGDDISFTYDEKLSTNASGLQVTMRRLSNNALIPATASIFENKIIVVPNSSITGLTGESISLVVGNVSDAYGNIKALPDTIRFTVGNSIVGTGSRALTVGITNPTVYKNDTAAIRVTFNLPVNAANETRVNYTIGGTARFGIDYTATYTGADALYAAFNGSTGSIRIPAGARTAILTLRPIIGDTALSPDKTIVISASEGGDYVLGATTSVTGNLTSEDGVTVYTFKGDGLWTLRTNWENNKMPLTTLITGKEIIISPVGTCILNVPQTVRPGAKITLKQIRKLIVQGNLKIE